MNVRELIEKLQQFPPETTVVLSNADIVIDGVNPLRWVHDNYTWDGDKTAKFHKLTDELKRRGYTDDDVMPDGQPVIVLFPEG